MQAAAVDAPPVQGAGRRRHHQGADGGRPDLPLRHGRRRGRPGHRRGRPGPGPVRRRRGVRRHARLQPARRQLAVRPAGLRPARRAAAPRRTSRAWADSRPAVDQAARSTPRRRPAPPAPFEVEGGENPYTLHQELQQTMNDLVGIIRKEAEIERGAGRGSTGSRSARQQVSVEGHRQFNPGWHLALDLRNMLLVSECVARAALTAAGEPRRAHPRRLPGDGRAVAAAAT